MATARGLVATSISLLLVGCGGKPAQPDPAEAKVAAEPAPVVETPPVAEAPAPEPSPTTPELAPEQPPVPEVIAEPPLPELGLTEAQRSAGLGRFDNPVPAKVEWARLSGFDELVEFQLVPLGVLADCHLADADYCELSDRGKLVTSKLEMDMFEFDLDELTGTWPDNAWFVETELDSIDVGDNALGLEILLASTWTGKKWAQKKREFRFEVGIGDYMSDRVARASWSGGLIVSHDSTGQAFNMLEPDNVIASFGPNVVWALTQTATGKVLAFRRDGDGVSATAPCLGDACKQHTGGFSIPLSTEPILVLRRDVSRGGDAMSFLLDEGGLTSSRQALLHYDPAGIGSDDPGPWRVDMPSEDTELLGIWADERGGLWVTNEKAQLLHRWRDGTWLSVTPPEGFVFESFAERAKPREFLAHVSNVDGVAVFAVRGLVTPAPEEPLVMPTPPIEPEAPADPAAPADPTGPDGPGTPGN
jgi:hypothetical protein